MDRKRSLRANALMWSLCQKIANLTGTTKDDVYRDALRQAGTLCADESIVRADGTARFPVSIPANGVLLIELTRMDA